MATDNAAPRKRRNVWLSNALNQNKLVASWVIITVESFESVYAVVNSFLTSPSLYGFVSHFSTQGVDKPYLKSLELYALFTIVCVSARTCAPVRRGQSTNSVEPSGTRFRGKNAAHEDEIGCLAAPMFNIPFKIKCYHFDDCC